MKSTLTKEQIKTVEVNKFKCDLCGIGLESEFTSENNDEVRIHSWTWEYDEHKKDMFIETLDCCINCFKMKIKPLIEKEFSVKFRKEKT